MEGYHERFYIEGVQKLLDLLKIKLLLLVDCGANIGNHSLFLGSKFKKVIAIEPNPLLFNLLKINCIGNKYKLLNTAVFENKKKIYLEIFRSNLGGGRVVNKVLNQNHKNIKIITTTLNNILRFEKSITLIKMDVEGHELQVLRGSNSILKKKPIILFEQNSWDTQSSKESAATFLAKLGYKFIWFKKNDPIEPNSHFIKFFLYIYVILFGYKINCGFANTIPSNKSFVSIFAYHPEKLLISSDLKLNLIKYLKKIK